MRRLTEGERKIKDYKKVGVNLHKRTLIKKVIFGV